MHTHDRGSVRTVVAGVVAALFIAACQPQASPSVSSVPFPSVSQPSAAAQVTNAPVPSLGPLASLAPPSVDLSNVPAKVHVAAAEATATWIGPAGGTLSTTSSDGTMYSLAVPVDAVIGPTPMTMTPITSVDALGFSGGLAGAVFLQPAGLALAIPATLTITTNRTAPAGTELVGFDVADDGTTTDLVPAAGSSSVISVLVLHFSAPGAAFGTTQDLAQLGASQSAGMATRLSELLALPTPWDATDRLQADVIITATWASIMEPELRHPTDDAGLLATIRDWRTFILMLNLDTHAGDPAAAIADGVQYAGSRSRYQVDYLDGQLLLGNEIAAALDGNTSLCNQSHDLKALANITFWAGLGVQYDPSSRDWNALAGGCAKIVVATFNPASNLRAGGSDSLQLVFMLEFGDGTRLPGDFAVTMVGSGFTFASTGNANLSAGAATGTTLTAGVFASATPPYVLTASACWFLDGLARNLCSPQSSLHFGVQPTAQATQPTLGAYIQVESFGNVPMVGVCQTVPIWFGVGHTGPNGVQFSLVTQADFTITGAGSLDPGPQQHDSQRIFRAGSAAGSATITGNGYVIDPSKTVSATLTMTIDPLVGTYRDPSTNEQVLVLPGSATGSPEPVGTYVLVVSGLPVTFVVAAAGSSFQASEGGHDIDLSIDAGAATGTIDGRPVALPRVCAP